MSTGEEDRIARSVALEKTYVHDVYDHMSALQYPEHRNTTPWPKVKKFLNELEPGSIVCDVGCGNGKYLKVNPSIFKIGSDRCHKLTQIAKDDDNEVLLCDNLTLPFRDETFDAVLSIAVIHHFATKERRVGALRELARVLRIGGRLMITVWAMEQKDRKFETQDVLVQWHHPRFYRSPSLEFSTTATATSEEDFSIPYRMSQSHVSDDADSVFSRSSSLQQDGRPGRSHLRLFQSLRSIRTSPSSSSLSSPNETCYSFVRKALQKLSRSSKKDKHRSRAWFLESWASFGKDDHLPATRYDPEGCEENADIQDLPIELRRMEKDPESAKKEKSSSLQLLEVNLTQKSKSLNDILSQATAPPLPITRSRSSIVAADGCKIKIKTSVPKVEVDTLKPKLVKQKKSICEEDFEQDEERDKATDMKKLVKELPIFKVSMERPEKFNVLKQKSLTEDIMSADRLREKEKVRQNIQKQASLNEDLIYRRQRTIDSFRDTFLSNSSKKFQMLRSGLTSKLKSSTTNIEKVAGASIKSGFAKIFQGLTGGELTTAESVPSQPTPTPPTIRKSSSEDRGDDFPIERRCSHEENSDSSKDNSLQSDTSVDSEDSIISVIERVIPKPEQATSPTRLTSPGPHSPKMVLGGVLSHPSSPKISQVMQYPSSKTKAFSLPASPRTIVFSPSLKQTFKIPPVAHIPSNGNGALVTPNGKIITPNGALIMRESSSNGATLKPSEQEPVLKLSPMKQVTAARMKSFGDKEMLMLSEKLSILSAKETEPRGDVCEGNESQKADTEQPKTPKEAHKKEEISPRLKTGMLKGPCIPSKKTPISPYHTYLANQTRLQSYELFNPEMEDIDTDSSGVSTPDSVGSVISVKLESPNGTPVTELAEMEIEETKQTDESSKECSISSLPHTPKTLTTDIKSTSDARITKPESPLPLHEAAASVASSLEGAVEVALKTTEIKPAEPASSQKPVRLTAKEKEKLLKKYPSLSKSPEGETWDKECRQYIVDLAENLSERLLAEIDRYKEQNVNVEKEFFSFSAMDVEDPYLTKLSEDLSHVSKLTKELSEDMETKPETDTEGDTEKPESSEQVTVIKQMDSVEEISDVILEEKYDEPEDTSPKDDKTRTPLLSDISTDAESPGSITGWLDSRRNTIESGFWKDREPITATVTKEEEEPKPKLEEQKIEVTEVEDTHRLSITIQTEKVRKLSKSEITSQTRLSIESTDTVDVSERTVSSSEDSNSKRDTTQTETSSGLSIESDLCELDKSADTSKSTDYKHDVGDIKYSGSQVSLLRPGESIESSDAGDISERTGSVSDFSRQNTESRSVITQSSASLASWSDCSKDIRFADRRTARCDGRSSSEETNPRAMLTRQQAATQEPSEVKLESTDTSLSGSTSQDSLTSESGGGSIMFHRYYHVFREGELDALIEEFVENLHIISSYYDHTNWCIIAEKVWSCSDKNEEETESYDYSSIALGYTGDPKISASTLSPNCAVRPVY